MERSYIFAVDFDGTCVLNCYPRVGAPCGAVPVLKKLKEKGHKLILLTMREGVLLEPAVKWFEEKGVALDAVNENIKGTVWDGSRKVYSSLFIDDHNFGCPLIYPQYKGGEIAPFVDWSEVTMDFVKRGIFTTEEGIEVLSGVDKEQNRLNKLGLIF